MSLGSFENEMLELLKSHVDYTTEIEQRLHAAQEEISIWRKLFLDSKPLMINEDRDKRIRAIFMATPTDVFVEKTPEENLESTINIFKNSSQPE